MIARVVLRNSVLRACQRYYSEGISQNQGSASSPPPSSSNNISTDVPGVSEAVIRPTTVNVGPGVDPQKTGAYKAPEYFCYDNMSYFEAEIEMARFRLPQPSALKKD